MSTNVLTPFSAPRRIASALAQIGVGFLPVIFLLYALLASGCTQPTGQHAPNLSKMLSQKLSVRHSATPGKGSGDFAAKVVSVDQQLPSLAGTRGDYSVDVSGTAHAVAAGQALAALTSDDQGNAYWMIAIAQNLASPAEMVMVAMPASLYAPGTVTIDGNVAIAYLVDANGNPLAYSTSGTLTLTAAPTALNGTAVGSFAGTFDVMTGCTTDTDCQPGQVCAGGTCITPDCSMIGCPAGTVCDPATLECIPAGCRTDAECGAGFACQNGQCVPAAGCTTTGCPAGMVCDPSSNACIPDGLCRADTDCPTGFDCVNGACRAHQHGCALDGCPAGLICDLRNGQCIGTACRVDSDCGPGAACMRGQCVVLSCAQTGCPAGMTCDPESGTCIATSCARTGCPSGYLCDGSTGQCVPGGCQVTGCPAGYSCDATTGQCVPGTNPGSCFPQPLMGQGSFSGTAGSVPMCSAADLTNLQGGPDAGLYDGADEMGQPATLLVLGDMTNGGDTYFIAVLDQCPAAGATLSVPATRMLILKDVVNGDTEIQVQKTAKSGTLTFAAGRNGGLTVTLNAVFGTDTVTGTATFATSP
jgi:Cys-rich repeat protein